jgi:hypothetical protein
MMVVIALETVSLVAPTQAHTVFGGRKIWKIVSWKKILWIHNFVVLKKCTLCLPDDIFRTESVRVKSDVHFLVLFMVIAGKRGVERSSFVPKGPKQIHTTLNHWLGCKIPCKVIAIYSVTYRGCSQIVVVFDIFPPMFVENQLHSDFYTANETGS